MTYILRTKKKKKEETIQGGDNDRELLNERLTFTR